MIRLERERERQREIETEENQETYKVFPHPFPKFTMIRMLLLTLQIEKLLCGSVSQQGAGSTFWGRLKGFIAVAVPTGLREIKEDSEASPKELLALEGLKVLSELQLKLQSSSLIGVVVATATWVSFKKRVRWP